MKRIIIGILTLVLIILPLAGCGNAPSDPFTEALKSSPIAVTGSGDATSRPFIMSTDEWAIDWSYVPLNERASLAFLVYPRGRTVGYVVLMDSGAKTSGSTYCYAGPGQYYIKVLAANIESWKIVITPQY